MDDIVVIKKYANRRLYNTETSMYVTLEDLAKMVREGRDFEVVDAKTGTDITHQVLTQIIFEEETRGSALMPIRFLRHMIRFYDNSMQSAVPHYLEMMMDVFIQNQGKLNENADKMYGGFAPFSAVGNLEEMQRRNMEVFQKTFSMFNPFAAGGTSSGDVDNKDKEIEELTKQVQALNEQIKALKKK